MSTGVEEADELAVAIIGMACRFPGAPDVGAFWRNLRSGTESIRVFSDAELAAAGVDPQLAADPKYVRAGGALDGIDLFDAGFFGISARDAEILDPQHRLFLECSWEALEHAGYDPERYERSVGVFGGTAMSGYLLKNLIHHDPQGMDGLNILFGNDRDSLATRVAYKLNLRGPCYSLQTFCSTSLVAVHVAAQSLLGRECDMALAGGVSVMIPQTAGYLYAEGGLRSSDGHCRAFDAAADGTPMGSGVGLVVLKRLVDALKDGDTVHAVIKGSAINNDGAGKVSYAAPGVEGQAAVVAQALSAAGVKADSIGYVEAHGSGTRLGDPVEVAALARAFASAKRPPGSCVLGSVKTNVGHLDRAAGVAGLIKAALCLSHREHVPTLHFQRPNPQIDFASTPFAVNTRTRAWESAGPRRAGVSSFGVGGTNAHVVLEEPPAAPSAPSARPVQLLVLSAKSPSALAENARRWATALREGAQPPLADVAFTAQLGRRELPYRCAVACRSAEEAAALLPRVAAQTGAPVERAELPVTFLLPGAGPERMEAVARLREAEPVFRAAFDACREKAGPDAGPAALRFALGCALVRQWEALGVRAESFVGEGAGEYLAAHLAGALPLEEALRLTVKRAQAEASPASAPAFEDLLRSVRAGPELKAPFFSNVTGRWISPAELAAPDYWVRQARAPPVAPEALAALAARAPRAWVEAGPSAAGAQLSGRGQTVVSSLPAGPEGGAQEALLQGLGALWCAGVPVRFSALWKGEKRRRVPLPTYAFERQRFWIDPAAPRAASATAPTTARAKDPADWFYTASWTQRPLLPRPLAKLEGVTLAFCDDGAASRAALEALESGGGERVLVRPGERFARTGSAAFELSPSNPSHYEQLCAELKAQRVAPARIVHAWAASRQDPEEATARGFHSLAWLGRAMARAGWAQDVQLTVVTAGAHEVSGDEPLSPEQALALGPQTVLAQELSNVSSRAVDVDPREWHAPSPALRAALARELLQGEERWVALRGRHRWVSALVPLRLPAEPPAPLRERGVYLITGGLGGIGLALAEGLVRERAATVVLTGRGESPPPEQWPELAKGAPEDPWSGRARRLLALQAQGGRVHVAQVDCADAAGMKALVADAERRFGALHGVIHAAGVTRKDSFKPLPELTPEDCERHFRAKVDGVRALAAALEGRSLDFCLLLSSVSSVLGGLTYASYAAANLYLDLFARAQRARGAGPWTSVGFSDWQTSAAVGQALAQTTLAGMEMSPEEGYEAAKRALASQQPHLLHSTTDLGTRLRQWVERAPASAAPVRRASHPRPQLMTPFAAPSSDAEVAVAELWQELLGVTPVGRHDSFFELGGNSLLGTQLAGRLRQKFGVAVPLRQLFEAKTPADLALVIEELILAELADEPDTPAL